MHCKQRIFESAAYWLGKQMSRKTQPGNQIFVEFQRTGIYHPHGGGIGKFLRLGAAKPIHEILRDHQNIRNTLQPSGRLVCIELINGIEGLELAAGAAVQLRKRHLLMDFGDHRFRSAVPVGVDRQHFSVAFQQNIIHAPGVDG